MINHRPPESFLSASEELGNNFELVQAAGGNTSIKEGDVIWIKASGKWLKDAHKESIFLPMSLENKKIIGHENNIIRPSIETPLHISLPAKVILHVHCINSIARTAQLCLSDELSELLSSFDWCRIPYVKPGQILADAIMKRYRETNAPIFILDNHGLVVTGETVNEAMDLLYQVVDKLKITPAQLPHTSRNPFLTSQHGQALKLPKYPQCHTLATIPHMFDMISGGTLYPDHAVFLGNRPLIVKNLETLEENQETPKVIDLDEHSFAIVEGRGVLVSGNFNRAQEEMLRCAYEVGIRLISGEQLNFLPKKEVRKLLNWDAEKHRQEM